MRERAAGEAGDVGGSGCERAALNPCPPEAPGRPEAGVTEFSDILRGPCLVGGWGQERELGAGTWRVSLALQGGGLRQRGCRASPPRLRTAAAAATTETGVSSLFLL